jgi:hypothetical protein
MYRDELEAAHARAQALEDELERLKRERSHDSARIAELERRLQLTNHHAIQVASYPPLVTSHANNVLILALLALPTFGLTAPFAWWLGNKELAKIDRGIIRDDTRGRVLVGKALGIAGTIGFLALGLVWFLLGR